MTLNDMLIPAIAGASLCCIASEVSRLYLLSMVSSMLWLGMPFDRA